MKLHHVQLAIPSGSEDRCREFYCGILGWKEQPKPSGLAKRGGLWLTCDEIELHLGVELNFKPARKAHPAFLALDIATIASKLEAHSYKVIWDDELEAFDRFYVADAVGNRLEFMQAKSV